MELQGMKQSRFVRRTGDILLILEAMKKGRNYTNIIRKI